MKKNVFLRTGIILLCLITAFAGLPVCAEETDAKHYYELNVNYNLFYNKSTQKTEAEITGGYAQLSQEDDASEDKSHIVVAIPSEISVSVWNNSVEQKQYYPVTRIARNAFRYINEYGEIVIPASVTDIDSRAFANGGIMSYNVDPENKNYMSSNGVIFSKDGKTLLIYPAGSEAAIYDVPEGTEKIGDYAFLEIRNLMQVNLPDSVTEIGKSAFKECWALRGISIPDSVTKIGEEAFSCCNSLRGIYIPALKNVSRTDIFDNYNVTIYTPSNSSLLEEGNNVKEMNNRIVRLDVYPVKNTYIESNDRYYLTILSLNLTFADGSAEYFDSVYEFQEKYGIYLEAESDQNYNTWGIGSHSFYVSAFGLTCEVPVNVVENPFESWEVITDIEVTDHMGGYYDYDNNRNMY